MSGKKKPRVPGPVRSPFALRPVAQAAPVAVVAAAQDPRHAPAVPDHRQGQHAPAADLQALLKLFQAGRHADMAAAAQALVARHPQDGQGWKALGTAQLVLRQDARAALQRAHALLPADVDVAANLGHALGAAGQLAEAAAAYRHALALQPALAPLHSSLGHVLGRLGQWMDAEAACRQALRLQPALAEAHRSLAGVLRGQARWADAAASLQQALRIQPNHSPTLDQLGQVLQAGGQPAAALAAYQEALKLQPRSAALQFRTGNALADLGRPADAATHFQQSLQLQPDQVEVLANLGVALGALGRHDEAVAALRQAVALRPGQPMLLGNLGNALLAQGQVTQALQAHQQAVALLPAPAADSSAAAGIRQPQAAEPLGGAPAAPEPNPDAAHTLANLAHALKTAGQADAALAAVRQALLHDPASPARLSELIFLQQYSPATGGTAPAADLQRYAALVQGLVSGAAPGAVQASAQAQAQAMPRRALGPDKPLRVGLLSADLREHPVGYFLESVLAALVAPGAQGAGPSGPSALPGPAGAVGPLGGVGSVGAAGRVGTVGTFGPVGAFEWLAYANDAPHGQPDTPAPHSLRARLQALCSNWRPVGGLGDAALAAQVQADGIDILLDLSGHTARNRLPLLAWRAAPVQASWLGYCASTGLPQVDAWIGDPQVAPPGAQVQFAEPVLRLPETFLCFTPPALPIPVGPLPALSAPSGGGIRFASFNQLAKLNDAVLALWSRILLALPGSTLALQAGALQDPLVCQQWLQRFAVHGIAAHRLHLQPAQPRADYLAAYQQVDIALDPWPYPGGTTSLEALWMGVPVLTLPGRSALSRQGQSILHNLGLHGWVAADEADYLARALQHAADLPALAALRAGLRQRLLASPLCDAPRFAGHLAGALRGLWQQRCAADGPPA